jgi:hypothetical protein
VTIFEKDGEYADMAPSEKVLLSLPELRRFLKNLGKMASFWLRTQAINGPGQRLQNAGVR